MAENSVVAKWVEADLEVTAEEAGSEEAEMEEVETAAN